MNVLMMIFSRIRIRVDLLCTLILMFYTELMLLNFLSNDNTSIAIFTSLYTQLFAEKLDTPSIAKCFQDDAAARPFKTEYEFGRNVLSRSTHSLQKARRFSRLGDPLQLPASSHAPLHAGRLHTAGDHKHLVMSMRDKR